ncbi:hypothetical protein X798_01764 [Onchocerca flexuosa]|uniref:Uncharacterized protein n=1 Tax=Onchocerca flexuosa TaxID=387005 RepID=A0A238C376_9BILA|nr:hypothetical protein X798_01764 [Onchocerca flexuosa]
MERSRREARKALVSFEGKLKMARFPSPIPLRNIDFSIFDSPWPKAAKISIFIALVEVPLCHINWTNYDQWLTKVGFLIMSSDIGYLATSMVSRKDRNIVSSVFDTTETTGCAIPKPTMRNPDFISL